MAFMFALARSVCQATASMKAEKWEKKAFEGDEIGGKTLGIIGLGNIGKAVSRRAAAMGMKVIAYDPIARSWEGIVSVTTLDELLAKSDYISLHLPKTKESTGMIGKKQFDKMKKGVRLINCGRGGIVDEEALYEALNNGKVAGAALDVFAEEPPTDWKLIHHPNVICSPHIGASTHEAQNRIGIEVAEKLIAFTNGLR